MPYDFALYAVGEDGIPDLDPLATASLPAVEVPYLGASGPVAVVFGAEVPVVIGERYVVTARGRVRTGASMTRGA